VKDMTCPWCEVALELPVDHATEQECPECLTRWSYEDERGAELPLAA
jgi:hypothetical protein